MSDFVNLIANAVSPRMSREQRDAVYDVARKAVLRIYGDETPLTANPQIAFQLHLIEETIRDIEGEIAKFLALERLRMAGEAQSGTLAGRRRRDGPDGGKVRRARRRHDAEGGDADDEAETASRRPHAENGDRARRLDEDEDSPRPPQRRIAAGARSEPGQTDAKMPEPDGDPSMLAKMRAERLRRREELLATKAAAAEPTSGDRTTAAPRTDAEKAELAQHRAERLRLRDERLATAAERRRQRDDDPT